MKAEHQLMTAVQFSALAELLRLREGDAQQVARLVLVEGLSTSEAARKVGASMQVVSNAVARCRRGIDLATLVVIPE